MAVRTLLAILLALAVSAAPAYAERPIVDLHRLDAYFALFAGDSNVHARQRSLELRSRLEDRHDAAEHRA